MTTINNPILPGFHPDPSICRAGEWYYIATSTFQWFPGVRIHRSRDLVNWELCPSPLTRTSQLDVRGVPDSGGVWAPCLSYTPPQGDTPGRFWLIYTNVRSCGKAMADFPNYLVTAESIDGPWSEPIYLNSSGFDPSLFHDDDGSHWLLGIIWDHRTGRNPFGGILLQQYDHDARRLIGPVKNIYKGTDLGVTEGPHLYKRDGLYYLLVAEGGTSWEHAVTIARSPSIDGPYETDPNYPMLTARTNPERTIQKSGHASLTYADDRTPILAHLGGRPIGSERRCILGRETSLQRCTWTDDGWLRLEGGGNEPQASVEVPSDTPRIKASRDHTEQFDSTTLSPHFQSLRAPIDSSWLRLDARAGFCRLHGRDSLFSLFDQSLIARRVQALKCRAATRVEFQPSSIQQMAGLIAYYDTRGWYYAHVTIDDDGNRVVRLSQADDGTYRDDLTSDLIAPDTGPIDLRLELDHASLRFRVRLDPADDWRWFGPELDATILSDDYGAGWDHFTGAFVGICCQDMTGSRLHADFDWFEYTEL